MVKIAQATGWQLSELENLTVPELLDWLEVVTELEEEAPPILSRGAY